MKEGTQVYTKERCITLGSLIGEGGEGKVFEVAEDTNYVAKIYRTDLASARHEKILAMLELKLSESSRLVTYPLDALYLQDGPFSGFLMHYVKKCQPVHELFSPQSRKQIWPGANYTFLLRCAANLARAVAAAHEKNVVIGDINSNGILVSQRAEVWLIDADSFQISNQGKVFPCHVGSPDYTAPELQGKRLSQQLRLAEHDLFGLAVILFQIALMGRHPFSATYAHGDLSIAKAIEEQRFAYSLKNSRGMRPAPHGLLLDIFPAPLAEAFEMSLGRYSSVHRRAAQSWVEILVEIEKSLQVCKREAIHLFPNIDTHCPWCASSKKGIVYFSPPPAVEEASPEAGKKIARLWQAIDQIPRPKAFTLPAPPKNVYVDPLYFISKLIKYGASAVGAFLGLLSFICCLFVPSFFLLWCFFGYLSFKIASSSPFGRHSVSEEYNRHKDELDKAIQDFTSACSARDFDEEKQLLYNFFVEAVQSEREIGKVDKSLKKVSAETQRHIFLKAQVIPTASVPALGDRQKMALFAYNVRTAADITPQALQRIPGVGSALSTYLLKWRQVLERRFRSQFTVDPSIVREKEEQKKDLIARHFQYEQRLSDGAFKLQSIKRTVEFRQRFFHLKIEKLQTEVAQAKANLEFLGP